MKKRPRIAILGPVSTTSQGEEAEQFLNVRRMCNVATIIYQMGGLPYIPALYSVWHMLSPLPRDDWIEISKNEILHSDACYRMQLADGPAPSNGADHEEKFCAGIDKKVFHDLGELEDWIIARRKAADALI